MKKGRINACWIVRLDRALLLHGICQRAPAPGNVGNALTRMKETAVSLTDSGGVSRHTVAAHLAIIDDLIAPGTALGASITLARALMRSRVERASRG